MPHRVVWSGGEQLKSDGCGGVLLIISEWGSFFLDSIFFFV